MEELYNLVTVKVKGLTWEINLALATIPPYFATHFEVTVKITTFITVEGHFSLTYEVVRPATGEKVRAESSFVSTRNLRNIVKYHVYRLYLELDKVEEVCGKCGRRHCGNRCPRILVYPAAGLHPPNYQLVGHWKPIGFKTWVRITPSL